ncbi:MAG: hypothetical protein RXQ75_06600 [Acidianus hospitalis]
MCVLKSISCVVPFGEIKAAVKVVGYASCGFCPVEYPYDPLGVAVEIMWAESFFTLIEIFLSVYNKFLLINNDLSCRCGLCPKGWEQRCEPRAVGVP